MPRLVLTRKEGESLRIGDSIVMSIVRVHGRQARVCIEAPPEVNIVRSELPPRIVEGQLASELPAPDPATPAAA